MDNRKKALNNLLSSSVQQAVTIVIGLLIPRLVITGYGSETNGLLNSVNQFMVYLALFEAGVSSASVQALYKPIATDNRQEINAILSATHKYYLRTGVLYFGGLILASLLYPFLTDSALDYGTIAAVVFLSGITNGISFFFQGKYVVFLLAEGRAYVYTRVVTVITVLAGLSKVMLLYFGFNVTVVLAASFVIHLLSPVCIYRYIKREHSWISVKETPNSQAISQKNHVLIQQIASMVFHNTDVLILTVFCSLKVVSVYSLYKLVITNLENLLAILYNGFGFSLGQTYQVDKAKFTKQINVYETCYSVLAFTLFSAALHLLLPFMQLYTRGVTDINYCDPVLPWLFVSIALLTAMRSTSLYVINFAGHFRQTTPQTLLEAGLNLAISIGTAPVFGICGVLSGTIAALLYRTADVILYSNRKLLNRSPWKTLSIHLANLLVLVLLWWIYSGLDLTIQSYLSFAAVGAADVLVTFVLLLAVQCLLQPELRKWLRTAAEALLHRRKKKTAK